MENIPARAVLEIHDDPISISDQLSLAEKF